MSRTRWISALSMAFLALMPVRWSPFSWNLQWCDLAALLLLVLVVTGKRPAWRWHLLDAAVIMYLVGSIPALTQSGSPLSGAVEYAKQLYVAALYAAYALLARTASARRTVLVSISVTAAGVAGLGLAAMIAYYGWGWAWLPIGSPTPIPGLGSVFRIRGTMISWSFFASFLAVALPMALALYATAGSPKARRNWGALCLLLLAAGLCTVSHSIVGMLVAGLYAAWEALSTGRRRFVRGALAAACLSAFVGVNAMSIASIREVHAATDSDPTAAPADYVYAIRDPSQGAQRLTLSVSYDPMNYFILKRIAWEAFLRRPLTGIGLDRFHEETERAYQQGRLNRQSRRLDPHSTFFGRLAETGLLGAVTLAFFWVVILQTGLKLQADLGPSQERWVVRAVMAGMIGLLVNGLNVDIMNFRFLWVGLGLLRGQLRA